jgi:hypothetical protein
VPIADIEMLFRVTASRGMASEELYAFATHEKDLPQRFRLRDIFGFFGNA